MDIIPSLLVKSKQEFLTQLNAVQDALEMIQLDIADGKFVPNTTWADPDTVEEAARIDVELHLMVENPLKELERWSAIEQIRRVMIQYESVQNMELVIGEIQDYGWDMGIVLNPDTPIDVLDPYLADIQAVMFMGVYPGFQGQKFISETLQKIAEFKSVNPKHFLEIDGGVNEDTLPDIIVAGADGACPGSAIFRNNRTPVENVRRMREIIERLTK